jgi:hypothetical protein
MTGTDIMLVLFGIFFACGLSVIAVMANELKKERPRRF